MAILACDNNEKEFATFFLLSTVVLLPLTGLPFSLPCSLPLYLFLNLSVTLYLLNTGFASVGLQLITGVITHILDDLIGEKAYKSS